MLIWDSLVYRGPFFWAYLPGTGDHISADYPAGMSVSCFAPNTEMVKDV